MNAHTKKLWKVRNLKVGTIQNNSGRLSYPVYLDITLNCQPEERVTIDLEKIKGVATLSISGRIGRNAICCGQIQDELRQGLITGDFTPEDFDAVWALLEIWDRWHLNDLKAGTRKQEAILDRYKVKVGRDNLGYEEQVRILKHNDLLEDSGYRYGSAWLTEPMPDGTGKTLKKILERLGVEFEEK
jgi:hypothetical protein